MPSLAKANRLMQSLMQSADIGVTLMTEEAVPKGGCRLSIKVRLCPRFLNTIFRFGFVFSLALVLILATIIMKVCDRRRFVTMNLTKFCKKYSSTKMQLYDTCWS